MAENISNELLEECVYTDIQEAVDQGDTKKVGDLLKLASDDRAKSEILLRQDKNGNTAIMNAARLRDAETVLVLRDACPKDKINELLSMKNNDAKTAWDLLRERLNSDLELDDVLISGCEMFVLMQLKVPTDPQSVAVNRHKPKNGCGRRGGRDNG